MELRKIPGTWFDSRSTWLARTEPRRAALLAHWNVNDSSFPVRIVNAALQPWLPFLGATVDPSDADQLCLEQHHLEFYFLGAFVASDVNVRRVENGAAFVLPSRLNDAFEALVTVGLDLTLDKRVTKLNGLGPTVFLSRISAAIALLPQLLELRLDDLISIEECDPIVDGDTWPSHMAIGGLLCPTTESLRPFADLRGLQGFFLGKDLREHASDQFHASATAIADKVMTNSLKSLDVVHYPRQVSRWMCKTLWASSLAIVRLQWPDVLEEVDERSAFQTEDGTQRAVVIRNRFAVLLLSLPNLQHWVSGGTSAQEYEAAVSLAQELLEASDHRSISAFRSLESFLSGYSALQLVVGMTASVSAADRCTALVARIRDERRNRPAGRDGGSHDPAPVSQGGGSTESVGAIFNNLASYGDVIEEFLRSPDVTGKLEMMSFVDDEGVEKEEIDTTKSGLLALVSHRDIRNNNKEILQVAYQRYSQVINQFLATKRHYRNPLFGVLATAREQMVDFITHALLCDDKGVVRDADKEWKVSQSYCDAVVKSGFDGVNHFNEVIVSLETERSRDSAPAPVNSLLDQWTQERSAELAVYVDRLANAFGAPRNDTIFGFSAFFRDVDLFLKRTPNAINKGYHKGKMCQEALTKPSERWRLMLRSPPPQKGAPAIVPRTFLRRTDPCFEQLRSRDQATEDLMKIDKLIPGALNAISSMASNPRSPGPPNPTPTPPPGGGGGGAGGGGKGKGKGKGANKRNADGSPKTDGPPSPPGKQRPQQLITPGTFASNCSWSAQVLTIKRDAKDPKTGVLKPLPSGIFDVGKFCSVNGIAFNDYCWEFVCSYWMSTFDKANRVFFDLDQRRAAQALRLACARCGHSSDTSNHPEALSAKHALPNHLAKMATYFRQG